jgi:hypothetical protein
MQFTTPCQGAGMQASNSSPGGMGFIRLRSPDPTYLKNTPEVPHAHLYTPAVVTRVHSGIPQRVYVRRNGWSLANNCTQ